MSSTHNTTDSSPTRLIWIQQFCPVGTDPWSTVEWTTRDCTINDSKGGVVFHQPSVAAPADWSDTAVNIAASKYFRGHLGEPGREYSVRQMIQRVASTIADWGRMDGYFETAGDAQAFYDDMVWLLLHQCFAFNSPVWFNIGAGKTNQASACFLNSVDDTMESIMELAATEARLFKGGSGAGVNLSKLRGSHEKLSGGGTASGPISFLRGYDAFAGVVQSGGACLAPWQKVYTDRGPVEVQKLAESGEKFVVVSYDPPAKRFKAKTAQAWKATEKEVFRITTDKGEFFLSGDHPVRLSCGTMCHTINLMPGYSLFRCSIDEQRGYIRVHLRDGQKGKELWHRMLAKDVGGNNIEGMAVHHKDANKHNNALSNLEVIHQSEHAAGHSNELVAAGVHVFQTERFAKVGEQNGMHTSSEFWQDEEKVEAYKEKQGKILKDSGRAREMQTNAVRTKMINTAFKVMNAGHSVDTFDSYIAGRRALGITASPKDILPKIHRVFGSFEAFRSEISASNHKVISVTSMGLYDTYDIEVDCPTADDKSPESGHTFVIWGDEPTGSGIVVFNTRRAAKMVQLNVDHPDIEEFISCKVAEEKKAHALIAAGYSGAFNAKNGAYSTVAFQNANHSIRVPDEFMQAAQSISGSWDLIERTTGNVCKTVNPLLLLEQMAEAAWFCGDPGLMFDTTINDFHTCPESGRINTVNPCGEFNFLDDTACNLASLNLMKFHTRGIQGFDYTRFASACQLIIVAQDILVDRADYPTEKFKQMSRDFRPLGLGYANLGSLLMVSGLGYGSDKGRELAAEITSAMHCAAYTMSAQLAQVKGPFAGYAKNKDAMLHVITKHWNAALDAHQPAQLQRMWELCYTEGYRQGFRNSQVTVLAPTGTIGMLMDCSTTGIEPNIALVSYKNLVGGGFIRLANDGVRAALVALGYAPDLADVIVRHVEEYGHVEGAGLDEAHLEVFDCALRSASGQRVLAPEAHILMMAAVQPFLSGAISKTVNCPNHYTVEDIKALYVQAWKLGLKSIAVYRDGCKMSQPLNTKKEDKSKETADVLPDTNHQSAPERGLQNVQPHRRRLPVERQSLTHKFDIGGHEGYITVGLHEDGTPGEIFLVMAKEGSTISGLMDAFATSISLGLQYGVPLETLVSKFSHTRFEPSGFTGSAELGFASSLIDYIFRWLDLRFGAAKMSNLGLMRNPAPTVLTQGFVRDIATTKFLVSDAPFCSSCGSMMIRSGSCYRCTNCGGTSGCS